MLTPEQIDAIQARADTLLAQQERRLGEWHNGDDAHLARETLALCQALREAQAEIERLKTAAMDLANLVAHEYGLPVLPPGAPDTTLEDALMECADRVRVTVLGEQRAHAVEASK